MLINKSVWILSVLTGSMLLVMGCQPKLNDRKESAEAPTSMDTVIQEPSLEGTTEKVSVTMEDCDGNNCPVISIDRLKTNQFVLDNLIDQAIIQNLEETLDLFEMDPPAKTPESELAASDVTEFKSAVQLLSQRIQPYVDHFIGLDKELKELGAGHQISLSISPKILNSQAPLATVVLNTSSYLGGAHGSASQTYYNFDLKKQKQISLDEILLPKQKAQLNQLAHAQFKQWVLDSQLAENVEQYEQAWQFKLTENYFLGQKGLILQYGEYEIGPYVVGLPRLTIPYAQLSTVIKPEYLAQVQPAQATSAPASVKK